LEMGEFAQCELHEKQFEILQFGVLQFVVLQLEMFQCEVMQFEVSRHLVVRSSVSDPAILTTVVATTVVADTSAPIPRAGHGLGVGQARAGIFRDSVSSSIVEVDVAGPSQPVGAELSAGIFYVSQDMDSDTLRQIYIPKWNVINDSVLDDPEICQGMIDHLAPPRFFCQLRGMDYKQLFAEFNVGATRQICFNAKIRMRLEHELRGRQRFEERCALQEKNAALEGKVAALESAAATSSLEFEKDKLVDQVSELETTCSGLRDEVIGYKLFKERVQKMQDQQGPFGRAIDKGMQDGLKAGVDYGRAGRGLDVVAAYDPSAEANFVSAVDALHAVYFPLLAQLESRKDASMADIFDLLHLEGHAAEIPEASQMQPLLSSLSSTSMVPSVAVTTALSTTFVQASTIPPLPSTEVPPSPKIVFEDELNTTLKHTSAP
ncbi:hypothetical protein Tco_1388463, partial [Tanacetum coccineum]